MNQKGFALIEVLLAVIILGFSASFIFGGFFKSISAIDESGDRLLLLNIANNDITDVKFSIENNRIILPYISRGKRDVKGSQYNYVIKAEKIPARETLCDINIMYYWFEGSRRIRVSRQEIYPVEEDKKRFF